MFRLVMQVYGAFLYIYVCSLHLRIPLIAGSHVSVDCVTLRCVIEFVQPFVVLKSL